MVGRDGAVLELGLAIEDGGRTSVDVIEALSDVVERRPGVMVGASPVDVSESVEDVWDVDVWDSASVEESWILAEEVGALVSMDEETLVEGTGPEDPLGEVFVPVGSEVGADTTDVGSCGPELEGEDGSGAVAIGSIARNKVSSRGKTVNEETHYWEWEAWVERQPQRR